MSTIAQFVNLLQGHGSNVRYRRVDSMIVCPCQTPEGFRNMDWHANVSDAIDAWSWNPDANGVLDQTMTVNYIMTPLATDNVTPVGPGVKIPFIDYAPAEKGSITFIFSWFVMGVTLQVYRSAHSGEAYVPIAQITSGTSEWTDTIPVAAITGTEPAVDPDPPICNEEGMLPDPASTVDIGVKAFVQPIQSTRATRLQPELVVTLFGEIQTDDHLGIFPMDWAGHHLNFWDWSRSGEDWIEYNGRRYLSVNANMIPDPSDGNPEHHWEVGLRLMSDDPVLR